MIIGQLEIMPYGKKIELKQEVVKIGRSKDNDIVINSQLVSKKHCQITFFDDHYVIEDLNSKNGTFINGEKVDKKELKDGDILTFSTPKPMFRFIQLEKENDEVVSVLKGFSIIRRLKFIATIILSVFFILLFVFFGYHFSPDRKEIRSLSKEELELYKKYMIVMNKFGEKAIVDKELLKKIKYHISSYKKSRSYKIAMERRKNYIKMIEEIFIRYKIPAELSYLALIESHYDPLSYNRWSGARGMWQLLPATARQYGLVVNRYLDERIDPVKSTEAAARYFHNLISTFGIHSITLTIAAFNAGDGKIIYSLKKIDNPVADRNFWFLYKNNLIPDETKEYVIKAIALMIMDIKAD